MEPNKLRAWMEIDLDAVASNYHEVCGLLPEGTELINVVKADAYGLGAVPIAACMQQEGCRFFAVATLEEAVELRKSGITGRIMTLGPIPTEQLREAVDNQIESTAVSVEYAEAMSAEAVSADLCMPVHIKLDLGLSRFGIVLDRRFEEALADVRRIFALPGLEVKALMGHITCAAGKAGDEFNRTQIGRYEAVTGALQAEGYSFKRHLLASNGYMNYPEYPYDAVRIGQLLYGSLPGETIPFELKPVVSLYTRVLQVKTVEAGTAVSYGPVAHTLRKTRIATVGIGFADGLRRSIINGGYMLFNGKKVPFLGKVCSDYSTLDITDVPECGEGDTLVLLGRSGDAFTDVGDYAAIYPASTSELTASFTPRLPRFYLSK